MWSAWILESSTEFFSLRGGGASQEFFGISWLQEKLLIQVTRSCCSWIFLDGSGVPPEGSEFQTNPIFRVVLCLSMSPGSFPGIPWILHPFPSLCLGFAGGVWAFPEIPGVLRRKKVGGGAPSWIWSWKTLDFPGIISLPLTQPHSSIPEIPSLEFPTDFSIVNTELDPFSASQFNSSSSPRILMGNNELQNGKGQLLPWPFPNLLLLAALQANAGGFGI